MRQEVVLAHTAVLDGDRQLKQLAVTRDDHQRLYTCSGPRVREEALFQDEVHQGPLVALLAHPS
eukprot:8122894-Lingulodinium_polyedra.AAC.1